MELIHAISGALWTKRRARGGGGARQRKAGVEVRGWAFLGGSIEKLFLYRVFSFLKTTKRERERESERQRDREIEEVQ